MWAALSAVLCYYTSKMKTKRLLWGLFFSVGISVAALDLWTKALAFDALNVEIIDYNGRPTLTTKDRLERQNIVVIADLFEFEAALNPGAFKGMFGDHTPVLALLSFVALILIALFLFFSARGSPPSVWFVLALGLLWGGTLGNFYDRWLIGSVRDFIKWFVVVDGEPYVWPNFNIADSGICTGVGLILAGEVLRGFTKKDDNPPNSDAATTDEETTP